MTLTRESIILIVICIVDLIATLLVVNTETAVEGNPLMGFYLKYGLGTFIMTKLTLVLLPIFVFEWSKQYKPQFVKFMQRATIAAYLGIYLTLFLLINVAVPDKDYLPPSPTIAKGVDKAK